MKEHKNRLAGEKSPYLLQHAGNPVDWYPWGEEAFEAAKEEGKPILLSIGYSTCHWCHVMAHESFEDPDVARLMNEIFVCIKVDREERPDVDAQYMRACQIMTGSGGWPLTIMMTAEKQPFFAATYVPKTTRLGRVGLIDLIPRIRELWTTRRRELVSSAEQVAGALRSTPMSSGKNLGEAELHRCYEELVQSFDEKWGGFGIAPKFPAPHILVFLLRYWHRTGSQKALQMSEKTLQYLQQGGIRDQIGSGFHRYSTDRQWVVPHFEKMIYDQALLASAFLEAYQATGNEEYASTARSTLDYVLRDMTSASGAFYAAEDADSEGEEGKFYLWTPEQIRTVLGNEDGELVLRAFNISDLGNFAGEATDEKSGRSIPYLSGPLEELAGNLDIPADELRERLRAATRRLFASRELRVRPHKDDKILTDWNGLMVAAMSQAARVLREPVYLDAACRAAEFLIANMTEQNDRLLHRYRDGQAGIQGTIDDYAFVVHGLLELYESSFQTRYLKEAVKFNNAMIEHFWDDDSGGLYLTADDGEPLLARQKEFYDGATPSGNSIAMLNMVRLSKITADVSLEQRAAAIGAAFAQSVRISPSSHTEMMIALDFALGPSYEVVIAGTKESSDMDRMISTINSTYAPRKVVIFVPSDENANDIQEIAAFTRDLVSVWSKATAYVCLDQSCRLPTTEPNELLKLLRETQTPDNQ